MIDITQSEIATALVPIEAKLEETRRRLLDLTRRNRLLNHRGQGRSALRIVDELPEQIFRLLVAEGRTLQFLAREEAPPEAKAMVDAEAAKEAAEARGQATKSYQTMDLALAPIAFDGGLAARHADPNLQTVLEGEQLQARLLHLSPFAALSRTIAVADAPEANCQMSDPLAWSPTQLSNVLEQLNTLDRWRAGIGDETTHPWRGIGLSTCDLPTRQRIQRSLQALIDALRVLQDTSQTLARQLLVEQPETPAAITKMVAQANVLLDAPQLSAAIVNDPRWNELAPDLAQWLSDGMERERHTATWSRYVGALAERTDWRPILQRRKEHQESLLGSLVPITLQDRAMRLLRQSWNGDAQALEQYLLPGMKPCASGRGCAASVARSTIR
jgi:hypothetical protein